MVRQRTEDHHRGVGLARRRAAADAGPGGWGSEANRFEVLVFDGGNTRARHGD